jgi:arylsulfatase A-like enzyme
VIAANVPTIRVPGIVRWPGKIAAAKVINQTAHSADIMPSLCALTGADPGKSYGENLVPVHLGDADRLAGRRPLVCTRAGYGVHVAVRLGDMNAIRMNLAPSIKPGPFDWEVRDLSKDRAEANDLSASRRDVITEAVPIMKRGLLLRPGIP